MHIMHILVLHIHERVILDAYESYEIIVSWQRRRDPVADSSTQLILWNIYILCIASIHTNTLVCILCILRLVEFYG